MVIIYESKAHENHRIKNRLLLGNCVVQNLMFICQFYS